MIRDEANLDLKLIFSQNEITECHLMLLLGIICVDIIRCWIIRVGLLEILRLRIRR